jgi:hypothetical protein
MRAHRNASVGMGGAPAGDTDTPETSPEGMRHALAVVAALSLAAVAEGQVPAGGEFAVNTATADGQREADAAADASGAFVVVWASRYQDGSDDGVFGQRFGADGQRRGAEFQVNTHTTGIQTDPRVASDDAGNFVVVWTSVGQDGSGTGVFGRRFSRDGAAAGGEFQVHTYVTGAQNRPDVAMSPGGAFLVAFNAPDGSSIGVAARRFDAAGQPLGDQFFVSPFTVLGQFQPRAAVAADGAALVVWDSFDGSQGGISGRRISSDGSLGNVFRVNSYTTGGQGSPSVAAAAGSFVVAWTSEYQDGSYSGIFARRVASNPIGPELQVNATTLGYQIQAAAASDRLGNFVVTWTSQSDGDGPGVFGRRFDRFDVPRGAEFRVNAHTTGAQREPAVAGDPHGNLAVAWTSGLQDGSDDGIFAQRYGGLIPAALAVDAAGNGVLEPGEAAVIAPSWRNANGATLAFDGRATFTGPFFPPVVYVTVDGSGAYGSVAQGDTGSCTAAADCYEVDTILPFRPVPHLDASLNEDLLPPALGQWKGWTIHIGESFTDVTPASGFYPFVETLLHRGVTAGCASGQYCPTAPVTREQMAAFVLVAREGPSYAPPPCGAPVFADVPAASPFCRWIEELARRGVAAGCGGGNYCPASPVTREQMAVFVLRTLDPALSPPPCAPPNLYADVPESSPFCAWIEELTARGVVAGCGGGNYCPAAAVTREQMGVFLAVTFGLTLYGP